MRPVLPLAFFSPDLHSLLSFIPSKDTPIKLRTTITKSSANFCQVYLGVPAAPVAPCEPCGPVAPNTPCGPWFPVGPLSPSAPLGSSFYKYEAYNQTSPTSSTNYNHYPVKFLIKVLATRELSTTGTLSAYNSLVKISTLVVPSGTWNLTASLTAVNHIGSASKICTIKVNGTTVQTKTSNSDYTLQYDTQLTSSATIELWAKQTASGTAETSISGAIVAQEVV